jgi:hypothetical protein
MQEVRLMGKLNDLRVERVDGVDSPATGHRWVIVKSDDVETPVEKDYAGTATAALEALLKEDSLTLSDASVEALRALAELLEMDVEFKSAEPTGDDEPEVEGKTDEPDVEKNDDEDKTYTADEVEDLLANALQKLGVDPEQVAKSTRVVPRSKQPKSTEDGGDEPIVKGKGLFANIVFGQD